MYRILIYSCVSLTLLNGYVSAQSTGGQRKLAPWVMTVIPPDRTENDTVSGPREFVELIQGVEGLDWAPNFSPKNETLHELAKRVIFRHNVWCLEFSFKPVRMLPVDVPQADGTIQKQLIWYMVYRVRNTGFHQNPTAKTDRWGHELFEVSSVNHSVRLFPRLVLESLELQKAYVDRVIPAAMEKIQAIEDPNNRFLNSVEISQIDIPVSTEQEDHSLWAIATWQNVDPRTDFFAVYVNGITNAYRWTTSSKGFQKGQPSRSANLYQRKTLQLNFWRPGDSIREHQDEVRYGIPAIEDVQGRSVPNAEELLKLYRVDAARDYSWVFR